MNESKGADPPTSTQSLAARLDRVLGRGVWGWAAAGAVLMWLAQPPLRLWPLAYVALVPWIGIAAKQKLDRRDYWRLYVVTTLLWAVTMQGIRHAHPAMYVAWWVLAAYLAVYPVIWIALARVALNRSPGWLAKVPAWLLLPVFWVGLEWVRNHFATGISAVMLGHTQADVPVLIQIADTLGSYGVSFLVALVNAAIGLTIWRPATVPAAESTPTNGSPATTGLVVAAFAVLATVGYGWWRLTEAASIVEAARSAEASPTGLIALIGRDEPIVFEQDQEREQEIFQAYFRETIAAAERAAAESRTLAAVVWPESMFTGGLPYVANDPALPGEVPDGADISLSEMAGIIEESRERFQLRAAEVQRLIRIVTGQAEGPDLVVGCAVVRYGRPTAVYCGCVHVSSEGQVADFYAKRHLVMFGEYIPAIEWLPWVRSLVPPGMGVTPGDGPRAMRVGKQVVSPNICIETAVERVTINQVRELIARGTPPDQIINVTNDGWFNGTSVVEHHLRAAQFVALGTRRPLLIAANGGPTAWIDGSGRIVRRLRNDEAGSILVEFQPDGRRAPYLVFGEWPAAVAAMVCLVAAISGWRARGERGRWAASP